MCSGPLHTVSLNMQVYKLYKLLNLRGGCTKRWTATIANIELLIGKTKL